MRGRFYRYQLCVCANKIYLETLCRSPNRLNSRSYLWVQFTCRSYLPRVIPMFLWIRLLGNQLNPGKNAKQLREMVNKMPIGIEETYKRDLVRILKLGEEKDRAIAVLRWTLFALRPLTVRELTEALAVDIDPDCDAYPRDDLPDTWEEEEVNDQIRRLCGS